MDSLLLALARHTMGFRQANAACLQPCLRLNLRLQHPSRPSRSLAHARLREMGLMDTLRSRSHAHSQPGTSPGPPSLPATSAAAATPATPATTTATTVPEHVGIIMDGNGRWARQRGAIASVGHKAGIEALQRTVEGCVELGVKYLSVFALSTENSTNRTAEEVSFLIRLVRSVVNERLGKLHEEGVRLRFIGNLEGIGDSELLEVIRDAEALTAANSTLTLTVALNFSGTDDIVRSAKAIAQRVLDGSISVDDIDAAMISERLSMGYIDAQSRAPDLLIRTGGEQRISNFLLWEVAYTELWFTDLYWPDWDVDALKQACADYGTRERRKGGR